MNGKKILDALSNMTYRSWATHIDRHGYSFMLAIWLFLHAGTWPPIETIWLFLHAWNGLPIQTTWFLLYDGSKVHSKTANFIANLATIMPYWEVHFLLNHVYGCVPAWRQNRTLAYLACIVADLGNHITLDPLEFRGKSQMASTVPSCNNSLVHFIHYGTIQYTLTCGRSGVGGGICF